MAVEVATWCEGCGPHENLGTCSECGHPIEAGVHPDLTSQVRAAVEALDTADLLADAIFEGVSQRTLESLARQHRVAREALSGALPSSDLPKETE